MNAITDIHAKGLTRTLAERAAHTGAQVLEEHSATADALLEL